MRTTIKYFTAVVFSMLGLGIISTAHANTTNLIGTQVNNACVDYFDRCTTGGYYLHNYFASGSGTSATIADPGTEFVSSDLVNYPPYDFVISADFAADTLHVAYRVVSTGFANMQLTFDLGLAQGASIASVVMTGNTLAMGATPVTFSGNHIAINVASQSINNQTRTADFKIQTVPVPAAAWLLGSGLAGLIGVARRRRV